MKFISSLLLLCTLVSVGFADPTDDSNTKKPSISGNVRDKANGEDLIGATVFVEELKNGTITNLYGFYSLTLNPGTYNIVYSYIGFKPVKKTVNLQKNMVINIELGPDDKTIEEVVVKGEKSNVNVKSNEMSVVKMQMQTIKKIPALMGEVDIIKAIQLLPGVQSTSEGGSGFSVRGGSADQNLIILDEATVYNASHLMGFFSVFNNDAIKDVKLYKGDIPASYGGRLSSLLDVRMKDGNSKKLTGTGGIGTISSRLTLEAPIVKDQTSFIVAGRRTYADIFLPFAKNKDIRDNKLYFYDLNMKINHQIDENNRVFMSGYFGRDVFKNPDFKMGFGNQTMTIRWNHLFSKSLFSNFTVIRSKFDYNLGASSDDANSFIWTSNLMDYGFKSDFTYFLNPQNDIKFGMSSIFHTFESGNAKGLGSESILNDLLIPPSYGLESGVYAQNEQKIGSRLTLKYGLRFSVYQNVGKATIYNFDENYEAIDSTKYKSGDFFNAYGGIEPRFGFNFSVTESSSIKGNYSRTRQYMQLAQNSPGGNPLDIWLPCSPNIKPQVADQFGLGYFKNFLDDKLETSVEAYYKKMDKTVDFKDHAVLLLNQQIEGEIRTGESEAYGLELFVKYTGKKISGWASYTFSHTERTIKGINDGKSYLAPYDKPHNISLVWNYELSKRTTLSANWVYATGQPITLPVGIFEVDGVKVPIYAERNKQRMPDYHRLDLALTIKSKEKEGQRWKGEWNFSVYNAYARHNPWAINLVKDGFESIYLFSFFPSVTYNFTF